MLTLKPDPSEVPSLVARMEAEITVFTHGLESEPEMHEEDAREHHAYVASLRSAIAALNSGTGECAGDREHLHIFAVGALDASRAAEDWSSVGCYAGILRRLDSDAS